MQPRVGVGAVILDGRGGILLTRRLRAPEAGHFSIPGGKVDFMEKLEDTVVREIWEETGLAVRVAGLLCVTDHILPGEGHHWVAPTYLCEVVGGELVNREPDKLQEMAFYPLDGLPGPLTLTTRAALAALAGQAR